MAVNINNSDDPLLPLFTWTNMTEVVEDHCLAEWDIRGDPRFRDFPLYRVFSTEKGELSDGQPPAAIVARSS